MKEFRDKNGKLCHLHASLYDFNNGRTDLSDPSQLLQVAVIRPFVGQTYAAHKHEPLERTTLGTQEIWIVMRGQIRVFYFDEDDEPLGRADMLAGEMSITYCGGHAYEDLAKARSFVIEVKNGPYYGRDADKTEIA